jgi:hypothetical protein
MALNFANNSSLANITSLPASISGGGLTLLQTQIVSSSVVNIDFTTNIDSTYDAYTFRFYDIHPSGDDQVWKIKFSTDGGSNYNATVTSTSFYAGHTENDSSTTLTYLASMDLAQSTAGQQLGRSIGNDNDQCLAGTVTIYNPSSTTYVKHFISTVNEAQAFDESRNYFLAGYVNTTSAVNAIRFEMGGGSFNHDSGVIKLYGIS